MYNTATFFVFYCLFPPLLFKWDEPHRARFRAELDTFFAKLYGLTEEELRYILDPQDIFGPDFFGETFIVFKEKEIRQFGEYRTKRLILEACEKSKTEAKIVETKMKLGENDKLLLT